MFEIHKWGCISDTEMGLCFRYRNGAMFQLQNGAMFRPHKCPLCPAGWAATQIGEKHL